LLEYNYIVIPPPSGFCERISSCGRCGRIPHIIPMEAQKSQDVVNPQEKLIIIEEIFLDINKKMLKIVIL
jgi:hypothetical protein